MIKRRIDFKIIFYTGNDILQAGMLYQGDNSMLLYSTILKTKDTFTAETFIQLVLEWNRTHIHKENQLDNVIWNKERNIRFQDEKMEDGQKIYLELNIQTYREDEIVAIRYMKKTDGGNTIWDTDYVANFAEHRIAIKLDRCFNWNAKLDNMEFSTPHFISMLIDGGYVEDDGILPVKRTPTLVEPETIGNFKEAIDTEDACRLPIVYVSKTREDQDPVDVNLLCSRLKGIAHVFLESTCSINQEVKDQCKKKIPYNGLIYVYCPHAKPFVVLPSTSKNPNSRQFDAVKKHVLDYVNELETPASYSFDHVITSIMEEKEEKERKDREAAVKDSQDYEALVQSMDMDNQKFNDRIEELNDRIRKLESENMGLHTKIEKSNDKALLYYGDKYDYYQNEIKEMVLYAVEKQIKDMSRVNESRRMMIYKDILDANHYEGITQKRVNEVKDMLKGYSSMSSSMRNRLQQLGFEFARETHHYELTYYDEPGCITMSKSGSDCCEGSNLAAEIINKLL